MRSPPSSSLRLSCLYGVEGVDEDMETAETPAAPMLEAARPRSNSDTFVVTMIEAEFRQSYCCLRREAKVKCLHQASMSSYARFLVEESPKHRR
ncbi:hypothetical protein GUJ93_ZPchr0010g10764 [Zizania palustris]|uniref:Uncharacterized protein n=1 Tax=Zizania palustris TaxID=103762 RepID=A0A8J5WBI7_ZIZPA|nr:hypothetical protein GUJ93_ZPchr0010g10764 [Zizania palustris]